MAISILHLQLTDVIEKLYEIEKFFYDATVRDTLVSLPFYLARSVSRSWPGFPGTAVRKRVNNSTLLHSMCIWRNGQIIVYAESFDMFVMQQDTHTTQT